MLQFASLALGCAIEDGTAFGSPYTIAATPAPASAEARREGEGTQQKEQEELTGESHEVLGV